MCQDTLTKYLIVIPMKNQTAETVAEGLVTNVILTYGIPNTILNDQGTNFMSEIFNKLCIILNINKIHTIDISR